MAAVQNVLYLRIVIALLSSSRGATATVVATIDPQQDASGESETLREHERMNLVELADDERSADGVHPLQIDKQWVKLEFTMPVNNAPGAPRRRRSLQGVVRAPFGERRRYAHNHYLAIHEEGYSKCKKKECDFYIEYLRRRRGVGAQQWQADEYTIKTGNQKFLYVRNLDHNSPKGAHLLWSSSSSCPHHARCAFRIEHHQDTYKIEAAGLTLRRRRRAESEQDVGYFGALSVWKYADITDDVAGSRRRWHWIRWNRCSQEGKSCECAADKPCELSISLLSTTTTTAALLLETDDADAPEASTDDSEAELTEEEEAVDDTSEENDDTLEAEESAIEEADDDTTELPSKAQRQSIMRSETK